MLLTAEIRWFHTGEIPAAVADWFSDGTGFVERQQPRVDIYLLNPETSALNVKFREGRLELKQRYSAAPGYQFAAGNAGTIELWRKWSFYLDRNSLNGNLDETAGAWLPVRKARTVRNYGLRPDGTVMPLSSGAQAEQACALELTEVDAGGERWWSLCFEALGPPSALEQTVIAVADHVLTAFGEFQLTAAASCGYAEWLQRWARYFT